MSLRASGQGRARCSGTRGERILGGRGAPVPNRRPPGPHRPHLEQVQRVRAAGCPARGQAPEVPARNAHLGRHARKRTPRSAGGPGPIQTRTPIPTWTSAAAAAAAAPVGVQSTVRNPRSQRARAAGGVARLGGVAGQTPPRGRGRTQRLKAAAAREPRQVGPTARFRLSRGPPAACWP